MAVGDYGYDGGRPGSINPPPIGASENVEGVDKKVTDGLVQPILPRLDAGDNLKPVVEDEAETPDED